MATTTLYMSMSLDGFIAGPNEGPGNGLGDGGERLHEWIAMGDLDAAQPLLNEADHAVIDEFMTTGAIIAGRGTFEAAGGWGGDHHDGVPIFILSRHEAPIEFRSPHVTYLPDITEAVRLAKEAAGDGRVLVHGASMTQRLLAEGLLDEIVIHLVPVLLGAGRPLFEGLGTEHIELETIAVERGREATHLRYRVVR